MGLFGFGNKASRIEWVEITSINELNEIAEKPSNQAVVIFKHSTRCSISAMAKSRLESKWDLEKEVIPVYLDLLKHRDISNYIAEEFGVQHESPQILVIKEGKCIYSTSHSDIGVDKIKLNL